MKIRLTEGELVRLVKRIMNENYFDNNFYIKNIKSICKGIFEEIEKYKKILKISAELKFVRGTRDKNN